MTELKTLKDIAEHFGGRSIGDVEPLSRNFRLMTDNEIMEAAHVLNHLWTELRVEAIKWIKHLDEKFQAQIRLGSSFPKGSELLSSMSAKREWIMNFFNLTEEDLK